MDILIGIGYCSLVIFIGKYIYARHFRDSQDPFSWLTFGKKNIGDYLMLVGVSFVTVQYSHEIIESLNYVLKKLTITWEIPHFEDSSFYWLLMPVVTMLLLGKFAKKKVRKPLKDLITRSTTDPDPPKPPSDPKK